MMEQGLRLKNERHAPYLQAPSRLHSMEDGYTMLWVHHAVLWVHHAVLWVHHAVLWVHHAVGTPAVLCRSLPAVSLTPDDALILTSF
jgi:hypothetical protein